MAGPSGEWGRLPEEVFADCGCARALTELLVREGHLGVSVLDEAGTFLFLSAELSKHFGGMFEHAIGRKITEVMPGPEGQERWEVVQRALRGPRPVMVIEEFEGVPVRTGVFRVARHGKGPMAVAIHHVGTHCTCAEPDGSRFEIVRPQHAKISVLSQLTPMELKVLRLIAQGMTTAQVANEIHRTVKTVEWHRAGLGKKLGLKTRVDLARWAIQQGVIDVDTKAPAGGAAQEK